MARKKYPLPSQVSVRERKFQEILREFLGEAEGRERRNPSPRRRDSRILLSSQAPRCSPCRTAPAGEVGAIQEEEKSTPMEAVSIPRITSTESTSTKVKAEN